MEKELKNYYEILEISVDSTQEEINGGYMRAKNAYSGHSLALYSLMSEDECRKVLENIDEAYSVLSIPEKRREYDRVRRLTADRPVHAAPAAPNRSIQSLTDETVATVVEDAQQQASDLFFQDAFSLRKENSPETHERQAPAPTPAPTPAPRAPERPAQTTSQFDDYSIAHREVMVSKFAVKSRFALEYHTDETFDAEIANATEFSGEYLQKIRNYKNVTLDRMAEMTKISRTYLKALETEDYSNLPAVVYIRGFAYQYAKSLKLNADLVATSYMNRMRTASGKK